MNEVGARKKIQNPYSPHQIRALHRLPACGQSPPRCCLIQLGEGWTCSSPSSWVSGEHSHPRRRGNLVLFIVQCEG